MSFRLFARPLMEADAVVLAGDIAEGLAGLDWARDHFPTARILFVAGDHEFYGARLPDALHALRQRADELDIDFLENSSVEIGGVRFLGATLWTTTRSTLTMKRRQVAQWLSHVAE